MASAITMRRSSWLRSSDFPPGVVQTVQDLPFEGLLLFSDKTDETLHSLKDSRATPDHQNGLDNSQGLATTDEISCNAKPHSRLKGFILTPW